MLYEAVPPRVRGALPSTAVDAEQQEGPEKHDEKRSDHERLEMDEVAKGRLWHG